MTSTATNRKNALTFSYDIGFLKDVLNIPQSYFGTVVAMDEGPSPNNSYLIQGISQNFSLGSEEPSMPSEEERKAKERKRRLSQLLEYLKSDENLPKIKDIFKREKLDPNILIDGVSPFEQAYVYGAADILDWLNSEMKADVLEYFERTGNLLSTRRPVGDVMRKIQEALELDALYIKANSLTSVDSPKYLEVIPYLEKAGELGSVEAYDYIANLYKNGSLGNKDFIKAKEYYEKAVALNKPGSEEAQKELESPEFVQGVQAQIESERGSSVSSSLGPSADAAGTGEVVASPPPAPSANEPVYGPVPPPEEKEEADVL